MIKGLEMLSNFMSKHYLRLTNKLALLDNHNKNYFRM